MKLQIVETIESDGRWIKVRKDDSTKACFSHSAEGRRTRDEAIAKAQEVFQFILENGDSEVILKEHETTVL
ncbi:MAG: hypothetical protein ABFC18_03405 [Rikenellaceae bacterium]